MAMAVMACACATEQAAQVKSSAEVMAPGADPVAPVLRTDGKTWPTRIALDLTVVPESKTLSGTARLELTVNESTDVVWLNATGLTISAASFTDGPAKIIAGNDDFVGFVPAAPLKVGRTSLDVRFTGPIDHERSLGVYAETEGSDAYVYTFFEPIDARRAFPCFDEPSAKTPWQLTLHVKKEHVARANTPVVKETDEPGGMKRVEFAESKPLPSYLVAFVVGPFEIVDGGIAGRAKTPIQFIVPKGRADELAWSKEITPKVVVALEDWFDMPYPFGKLDVAVVPRYWGTMEHPGLVAMGQPLMLIRPDELSRPRKQHAVNILAHELAHYWFGDLVTAAWWDDTWLNESLGSWMDQIITQAVAPEWHVADDRTAMADVAMGADELLSTQPIRLPVTTRTAIASAFSGEITYLKGASVMRMFEASAGREKWRTFIQQYLRRHEWKNANTDAFIAEARAALGDEVGNGLVSFLTQPGVPLIEGAVVCEGEKRGVTLRQRRSLPSGVKEPTAALWSVPVCLRAGDASHSARVCTTLSTPERFVPLEVCPTWVVLNDQATGYYRSVVDLAQVTKLFTPGTRELAQAKPSVAEQTMLLSDVSAAVSRDEVQLDAVLRLVPLIQRSEDDRVAIEAFGLGRVPTEGLEPATFEKYLAFRRSLCAPMARKLGWQRAPTDSDERQRLRARALICAGGSKDPATGKQAGAMVDVWLKDRAKSGLPADLVTTALHSAAVAGDSKRFDALLEAARKETDHAQRGRLLWPLGAFSDPVLASRARELVLAPDFDLRETHAIVMTQLGHPATRDAAWAWIEANLATILSRSRADEGARTIGGLAGVFCDDARRARAQAVLTPAALGIDGADAELASGLERSAQCIAELKRTLPALNRFLSRK